MRLCCHQSQNCPGSRFSFQITDRLSFQITSRLLFRGKKILLMRVSIFAKDEWRLFFLAVVCWTCLPPGLPPRARLHVVGMLRFMSMTKTSRTCPFFCILFSCLFLSFWPFQLYFTPQILLTTLRVLILFFSGLISAFLVLSTRYLVMRVSFSTDIIPSG